MKAVKRITLVLIPILLIVVAFLMVQRTRGSECFSPITLLDGNFYKPEVTANRLISQLGGLPKTDLDVHEALELLDTNNPPVIYSVPPAPYSMPPAIYPVAEWEILSWLATDRYFTLASIFDEPEYSHSFTMHVTYVDGDEAILEWSSWNYGFVVCPIVVAGLGPPGYFTVVQE